MTTMKVGTVKEIKKHEYRVGMTPYTVQTFIDHGHTVYVQKGAGEGTGISDAEYLASGAILLDKIESVYLV
jgi:alanine dehydrogenase